MANVGRKEVMALLSLSPPCSQQQAQVCKLAYYNVIIILKCPQQRLIGEGVINRDMLKASMLSVFQQKWKPHLCNIIMSH